MRHIEGQVPGIAKMIENDEYCIDVFTPPGAKTPMLAGADMAFSSVFVVANSLRL